MRTGLNDIQWCPGCGDFLILSAIRNSLKELGIAKENTVIVSGIGCGGKMSQYIDGYAAETLHGRAIPFATGVKLSNPDLTVIVISGDGDGYGIGLAHFLNACRRNVNLTYIVCNNENYGLTTGQASPTTPVGAKTKTTPGGNTLPPIKPNLLAVNMGCSFFRDIEDRDIIKLKATIKDGIQHPGFAFINVKQKCPSWKKW